MSIQGILDAQQRLVILRSLLDIGGAANESILNDCLDQLGTGRVSRTEVKTLLAWLEEQGCAHRTLAQVQVAHLTGRGQDAAEGRLQRARRPAAQGGGLTMAEKTDPGRPSKVWLLPEGIRDASTPCCATKANSQAAIPGRDQWPYRGGRAADDLKISRSGLSRHASQVEQVGQHLRDLGNHGGTDLPTR